MTYFDTAYVLRCYVQEPGSERVRAFARGCERLACSVYGRLELHAALHRKLREGRLDERGLDVVLRQLSVDESVGLWEWLPLTARVRAAVADVYGKLSRDVFLRTGDAVHLLSAREHGLTKIYSSDRRLLAAAPHVGIEGRDVIGVDHAGI
jgi:predicted nucleic acid-binding protein